MYNIFKKSKKTIPPVILGTNGLVTAKDLVKHAGVLRQLRAAIRPISQEEKDALADYFIREVKMKKSATKENSV